MIAVAVRNAEEFDELPLPLPFPLPLNFLRMKRLALLTGLPTYFIHADSALV